MAMEADERFAMARFWDELLCLYTLTLRSTPLATAPHVVIYESNVRLRHYLLVFIFEKFTKKAHYLHKYVQFGVYI